MWTTPGIPVRSRYFGRSFLVAMKLGEMLVRDGKITPEELEDTLNGQAIFGGRFGTNLVEMGFLEEDELTHFLSQKCGVPHASPEQLMNIAPQVIRLLPEEAVKKYRVVPLALNNRKLSLAMTDPSDFTAIDEISFATGYIVVPLVTPELRLISALEKYYNIKRDLRYIPVAGGGRKRARVSLVLVPPPVVPAASASSASGEPDVFDIFDIPQRDEVDFFGELEEMQAQPPVQAAPAVVGVPRVLEEDFSLDAVLRGLAQASERERIAELIVGYCSRQFNRSALFLIKGGQATGWIAKTGAKPRPAFDKLDVSLNEASVLRTVAESKACYLGAMPISPCNSRICAALGGDPPPNQLLAPLLMMGRVVAILYVDGSSPQLDERVPELQKLLAKCSTAFEILILKSKILLT